MGHSQSKENVVVATAVVNQKQVSVMETKINQYGIMLLILLVLLLVITVYAVWVHCRRRTKKWLKKEIQSGKNERQTGHPQPPPVVYV